MNKYNWTEVRFQLIGWPEAVEISKEDLYQEFKARLLEEIVLRRESLQLDHANKTIRMVADDTLLTDFTKDIIIM